MDKKKVLVMLDPGHTKSTPGKCSPDHKFREYLYAREIVKGIEAELEKLGIQHWNDHPEDDWADSAHKTDSKDLVLRCKRINSKYAKAKSQGLKAFMISVHVNAASNGEWKTATGWCAYTTRGQNNSDKLAEKMYQAAHEVLDPLGKKIREDKSDGDADHEANFYVLKNSNCVCTLTENFFQDNKDDVAWLSSDAGKKAIIDIHIKGILKYIEAL